MHTIIANQIDKFFDGHRLWVKGKHQQLNSTQPQTTLVCLCTQLNNICTELRIFLCDRAIRNVSHLFVYHSLEICAFTAGFLAKNTCLRSVLLSLKAEILRKQQELSKVRVENDVKVKALKKTPLEIKNKGVEARDENDQDGIDVDLLKQSKLALEYKTQLYDKLSSGKVSEDEKQKNKLFLVRFDKKNSDNNDLCDSESDKINQSEEDDEYQSDEKDVDPGEKWVDYIDSFGRTRKCMQKDLAFLKSKDEELKNIVEKKNVELTPGLQNSQVNDQDSNDTNELVSENKDNSDECESELKSNEMRREILRQQWEKEEEHLRNKSNIHYQDILFGEARTHGVGYYGFSKDEEERAKQQEALKNIRKETEEKQKKAQELRNSREKLLTARLKAARNRKRARMGLPPEEDEPAVVVVSQPEISEEELIEHKKQEEKEKQLEEARKHHLRPWDIGKEGVKEHYIMTQEEWVEKKREERPVEFAPPTNYRKNFRTADTEISIENLEEDNSLKFTTKRKKISKKTRVHINRMEKLENNLEKEGTAKDTTRNHSNIDDTLRDYQNVMSTDNKYSKFDYHQAHKNFNNRNSNVDFEDTLLQDYINISNNSNSVSDIDDITQDNSMRKRQNNEVAPPPTYDYYGPSQSKIKKNVQIPDIQDSIEAGLKFLRKQVEQKEKSSEHMDDIFLF